MAYVELFRPEGGSILVDPANVSAVVPVAGQEASWLLTDDGVSVAAVNGLSTAVTAALGLSLVLTKLPVSQTYSGPTLDNLGYYLPGIEPVLSAVVFPDDPTEYTRITWQGGFTTLVEAFTGDVAASLTPAPSPPSGANYLLCGAGIQGADGVILGQFSDYDITLQLRTPYVPGSAHYELEMVGADAPVSQQWAAMLQPVATLDVNASYQPVTSTALDVDIHASDRAWANISSDPAGGIVAGYGLTLVSHLGNGAYVYKFDTAPADTPAVYVGCQSGAAPRFATWGFNANPDELEVYTHQEPLTPVDVAHTVLVQTTGPDSNNAAPKREPIVFVVLIFGVPGGA